MKSFCGFSRKEVKVDQMPSSWNLQMGSVDKIDENWLWRKLFLPPPFVIQTRCEWIIIDSVFILSVYLFLFFSLKTFLILGILFQSLYNLQSERNWVHTEMFVKLFLVIGRQCYRKAMYVKDTKLCVVSATCHIQPEPNFWIQVVFNKCSDSRLCSISLDNCNSYHVCCKT